MIQECFRQEESSSQKDMYHLDFPSNKVSDANRKFLTKSTLTIILQLTPFATQRLRNLSNLRLLK